MLNQNLERILYFLEQKNIFLLSLGKLSSAAAESKGKSLAIVEKIVEKARISHSQLRTRIEFLEEEERINRGELTEKNNRARIVKMFGKQSL